MSKNHNLRSTIKQWREFTGTIKRASTSKYLPNTVSFNYLCLMAKAMECQKDRNSRQDKLEDWMLIRNPFKVRIQPSSVGRS